MLSFAGDICDKYLFVFEVGDDDRVDSVFSFDFRDTKFAVHILSKPIGIS